MRILIRSIPHQAQRYNTCGDWYWWDANIPAGYIPAGEDSLVIKERTLHIRVSMLKAREMWLVAVHELIEALLCDYAGVSMADVDAFDTEFKGEGEPGDDINAPYYRQHQIATGIERMLAAELGVAWREYEEHINELG